ncbi:MAG: sigma 54-interacting transcriptional regulator [Chitinispirillaceae bacterium]|nr:sigma 54-interacting transcriptional regulator [Chitinispirillaceae bacterium]
MKKSILFVDEYHDLSVEAARIAAAVWPDTFTIVSAGIDPRARFTGVGESAGTVAFAAVAGDAFDIVISMGHLAAQSCAMLPGLPPVIIWDDLECANSTEFDEKQPILRQRVESLGTPGALQALVRQRSTLADVIDSLQEGVIAHDRDRKVFLFSRGAERITGVDRGSVIGRDCHELFQPRLCGESCAFCGGAPRETSATTLQAAYATSFIAGDGVHHDVEVSRLPLSDAAGNETGALITFTDTTRMHELEARLGEVESFSGIIGRDHRMLEIYELVRDLADSDFPVVITGESGTGKELVAAAIHNESLRRDQLFVPVNCGALPEGTLESELFGHLKGAFTGAIRDKKGRFELADRGTLFLDEIGDLSLPMQVKLLRVLQEGIFEPVGSETSRKVDVRVICATNRNLREMVAKGAFREDLFYRLAVVPIEMPPLRERRNDIPLLARHFLEKTTGRLSRGAMTFSDDAMSVLMNYAWPGNVRQLQNAIQFALIKCRSATVMPLHLPPEILAGTYVPIGQMHVPGKVGRRPKLTDDIVERALAKAGGNKAKAARLLGVGRATLYNFINGKGQEAVAVD